jgi:catechol 2,3-dioxygenase-like lactoylglutathione lyase family enzyme
MKPADSTLPSLPPITGVLETALYVDDLSRSIGFYQGVFGLRLLQQDHRFCAFDVAGRSILLLFLRGASREASPLPWGDAIPPHDGSGPLHFAFAIPRGSDEAWKARLHNAGIAIESIVNWPRGGRSLYFRDPDGHALELVTPGVWETY